MAVSEIPTTQGEVCQLADLFKLFSDETRIRIMGELCGKEASVTDIAETLQLSISAVSHQLQVLRMGRLVRSHRHGKQIFYTLADEHVHQIITVGYKHIAEII